MQIKQSLKAIDGFLNRIIIKYNKAERRKRCRQGDRASVFQPIDANKYRFKRDICME